MIESLTDRQREIYDFICGEIRENHRPPTVREICDAFGFKSPNGAKCHVNVLVKKNVVKVLGGSRGIVPLVQDFTCPVCGREDIADVGDSVP